MIKRKTESRLKPLSLAGVKPEDALKAFMEVKPKKKDKKGVK